MPTVSRYFKSSGNNSVECLLCPHRCILKEGQAGICGVRINRNNTLVDLAYGTVVAMHMDPVEKKPLFHFHPGSSTFSIASAGCNLRCVFCQNYSISRVHPSAIPGKEISSERLVDSAIRFGSRSVSYTYTEPTAFFEFAFDTARLARRTGLKNIFVTNGFIESEPLSEILPFLNAANVDLKFFDEKSYKKYTGGSLAPVLRTIETMKAAGIWIEVTTLVIPEVNDSDLSLKNTAEFIAGLDVDIPWHISRFYPHYMMQDREPTSVESLRKARDIGLDTGLHYVYTGNIPGDPGENTYCHSCGTLLIERRAYSVKNRMVGSPGVCPSCGEKIPGIW